MLKLSINEYPLRFKTLKDIFYLNNSTIVTWTLWVKEEVTTNLLAPERNTCVIWAFELVPDTLYINFPTGVLSEGVLGVYSIIPVILAAQFTIISWDAKSLLILIMILFR